jgi:hypothetical protein
MMIRCEDCKDKWVHLPPDFFEPRHALAFWLQHGHIPKIWTFVCECGIEMQSGPQIARENGWDDIALAQNDWLFWQEHKPHATLIPPRMLPKWRI